MNTKGLFLVGTSTLLMLQAAIGATVSIPLKEGWRFVKQDDPKIGTNYTLFAMSETLDRARRGDLSGAPATDWAAPGFDDSRFLPVRVPHDWGVMKGFDTSRPYGDGFLDVTGVGWYRRKFRVSPPAGGTVFFECDGAMSYAHVWVNGRFAGGWPYGYTRWRLDITRFLVPGENTLAIRCHNVKDSSRWYSGGGLYRNCRLLVCPRDYVVPGSVAITTPEVSTAKATVRVRYRLSVSGAKERTFTIANPHLWDIDDPYLYTVTVEGNRYRYGIRTIAFHADERRFQLNGRTVPLNGVCMHHDFGVLGAAWNRAAQKRRLLAFKEAGVNAIRSAHNPPDEGLLDLCDELGLLVKDEAFDEWKYMGNAGKRANGYHNIFDTWHERDLRAWVQTDRNHPCVILWSLGNEICDGHAKIAPHAEYVARAKALAAIVASEDKTRPTTNANNNPVNYTNDFPSVLGVMGCNYFPWQYPRLKKAWPQIPFFGSETICSGYTRGEYRFPVVKRSLKQSEFDSFYMTSYCWESCGWNNINGGWACPPDAQWYWMDQVKTCMGEFVWAGIDYLGGPYWCTDFRKKPHFADPVRQARALEDVKKYGMAREAIHTCDCGFLDQAGFRKDAFYLFQSRWRPDLPMAHILPHWNWPERVGKVTPVYVFTTGDEAELFLNGVSLGRRRKEPGKWNRAYRLCWDEVLYAPGELVAVAYRNGREWAREKVRTTGAPAALRLEPETHLLAADGEDLCFINCSVRDSRDDVVPRTRNRVRFAVEGPGEIVATDNGDETNMDDFHRPEAGIFNGWAQVIVRAKNGAKGTLKVVATAEGLASAATFIGVSAAGADRAPRTVAVQPCAAVRNLCVTADGEIRHYGWRMTNGQRQRVYIASRDNGENWVTRPVEANDAEAMVKSPWSGEWIGWQYNPRFSRLVRSAKGPGDTKAAFTDYPWPAHELRQLLPMRSRRRWVAAFSDVRCEKGECYRAAVALSDDDGHTWRRVAIPPVKGVERLALGDKRPHWFNNGCEPSVTELSDGTLLMAVRTSGPHAAFFRSTDGGETWGEGKTDPVFWQANTMPYLFRLKDGRLLFFWNNTTMLPTRDLAENPELGGGARTGQWESVFTNRDALHAAISEDDGRTWIGFREVALCEVRNAADFRELGNTIADEHDKSVHQSQAIELDDGTVLLAYGQNSSARRIAKFDPNFLYETSREDDFRHGLRGVSTHLYVRSLLDGYKGWAGHCAWNRVSGALLVREPDTNANTRREALQLCRIPDPRLVSDRQGIVWNFPALRKGRFETEMRLDGEGFQLALTDHWLNPCDEVNPPRSPVVFEITNKVIAPGLWHRLVCTWESDAGRATLFCDGRKVAERPMATVPKFGLSYAHLQTLAKGLDAKGAYFRSFRALP